MAGYGVGEGQVTDIGEMLLEVAADGGGLTTDTYWITRVEGNL